MSKILSRIARFFSNRTLAGVDKAGNLYFTRTEEIDGIIKEKRWVVFKGEEDPTSIPVEWISWLNGQRKVAPTPEEMAELEARRERIRLNVARLKEEEQKKLKDGSALRSKVGGPNLQSFIRQFPASSEGDKVAATVGETENLRTSKDREKQANSEPGSSEPTGSGASFKPGAWQPPT